MKVAVLIQGEPRFCSEFDLFLDQVNQDGHEYHWYLYMWNPNPGPEVHGYNLIADCWRSYSAEQARERLSRLLPPNHRVIAVETADQRELVFPSTPRKAGETHEQNVWKMFYSLKQADTLRQIHGMDYDLVIKARPDVSVRDLNLAEIWAQVSADPQQVIISKTNHHGYWGTKLNDWAAVARPEAMAVYCSVYDRIMDYYNAGFLFHPESLLSFHLAQHGVAVTYGSFEVGLRHLGETRDHCYYSNFGRWA